MERLLFIQFNKAEVSVFYSKTMDRFHVSSTVDGENYKFDFYSTAKEAFLEANKTFEDIQKSAKEVFSLCC